MRPPPRSPLFPYTTLFRSDVVHAANGADRHGDGLSPGAGVTPRGRGAKWRGRGRRPVGARRSEEHTSELQSRGHLVCRLLLEKKKITIYNVPGSAIEGTTS